MIAAIIADYAAENARGKLVGICFFLNGIGVATLVLFGGRLPQMVEALGGDPIWAARCAYWTVAAACLLALATSACSRVDEASAVAVGRPERIVAASATAVDVVVALAGLERMVGVPEQALEYSVLHEGRPEPRAIVRFEA